MLSTAAFSKPHPDAVKSTNHWGHSRRILVDSATAGAVAPTVLLHHGGGTTSLALRFLHALALALELGPAQGAGYAAGGGGGADARFRITVPKFVG